MIEKARFNITAGMTVAFDFESFYDSKARYSLRVMTPYQYVMDPRFDAYLVAFNAENGERWVGNPQRFDWSSLTGAHMIAHNAAFDGLVLKRLQDLGRVASFDYTLDCTADMVAYFCVPRSLKDAAKRFLGETVSKAVRSNMDGRQWSSLTQDEVTAVVEYGGGDADLCLRLWQAKSKDWPEFERKVSRLNREAGWRGVRINRKATIEGLKLMQKVKADAEAKLPWVQRGIGAESTAELARHAKSLGLPIPNSFNKQDPAMQAWIKTHAEKHPFIQARIDVASVTKHIARLESMLELADEDDIIRFSSKYYGAHCLSGDHEVLTKAGWVRLDMWGGGEIAQWTEDFQIRFDAAWANRFVNTERTAVEIVAPGINAVMTHGHKIPAFARGNRSLFYVTSAGSLLREARVAVHIPVLEDNVDGPFTFSVINPAKHCREVPAPAYVYCPTTVTGFFLCRRQGSVFVSGNTGRSSGSGDDDAKGGSKFNVFNIPKGDAKTGLTFGVDLRGLLIPRPGYRFVINDYGQIEPRITHWFAGNIEFLKRVFTENIYQAAAKVMGWYPDSGTDLKHESPKLYKLSKACLAPETLVLTDRGYKRIVDVMLTDMVWDGQAWVAHQGVVCNGERKDITAVNGERFTQDHEIHVSENLRLSAGALSAWRRASALAWRCAAGPGSDRDSLRALAYGITNAIAQQAQQARADVLHSGMHLRDLRAALLSGIGQLAARVVEKLS